MTGEQAKYNNRADQVCALGFDASMKLSEQVEAELEAYLKEHLPEDQANHALALHREVGDIDAEIAFWSD